MNIVNVNAVSLLEGCTSRREQLVVEKYIFGSHKLPSPRVLSNELRSVTHAPFKEFNRSCFKQLYLEKFALKFPFPLRDWLLYMLQTAIMFKIIQYKELFLILNESTNDDIEWNETTLRELPAIWKVLLQVSKLCPNREVWPNIPM